MSIIRDIKRQLENSMDYEERKKIAKSFLNKFEIIEEARISGRRIDNVANLEFMPRTIKRVAKLYSEGKINIGEAGRRIKVIEEQARKYLVREELIEEEYE